MGQGTVPRPTKKTANESRRHGARSQSTPRVLVFVSYDRTGNVLTADYAGEQTETNTYNELGLLTTVTTAEGDTLYQYDDASRLLSVTQPSGETVSYTYDSHGNRATMTYPNGKTVKYTYP